MGRIARSELLYKGCYAHVFSRSISKEKIFTNEESFRQFKRLLKESKVKGSFALFHYSLIHTHFHMAVQIHDVTEFSDALKDLKRNYTFWYNTKTKRRGPLWRERFKSMLIENESYLYACGVYIEQNPVKAGIVERQEQWPHSSAVYYQTGQRDNLIDPYKLPQIPQNININDERQFTKGSVVGSEIFKILAKQEEISIR